MTLDELPFLGPVVEIEGDGDEIEPTARRLGLDTLPTSTETYLSLFERHLAAKSGTVPDMTFAAEAALSSG